MEDMRFPLSSNPQFEQPSFFLFYSRVTVCSTIKQTLLENTMYAPRGVPNNVMKIDTSANSGVTRKKFTRGRTQNNRIIL